MTFEEAVEVVLKHEGGYVNHPLDPGGETKYGISKRAYPHVDILNLRREEAIEIYRKDYWEKVRADDLPASLRLLVFDAAVNQGVSAAIRLLQQVVNVEQDGILGPNTLRAVNNQGSRDLVFLYVMARHAAYARNPRWDAFGRGWSWRLLEVTMISLTRKPRIGW